MSNELDAYRISHQIYTVSCLTCGHHVFEEAATFQEVFVEKWMSGELYLCAPDYQYTSPEDGKVSFYRCVKCGWVIPGVYDTKDLAKWVETNGQKKGRGVNVRPKEKEEDQNGQPGDS